MILQSSWHINERAKGHIFFVCGGSKTLRFYWNWLSRALSASQYISTWWQGSKGKGFYVWWLLQRFFSLLWQKYLMKKEFVFTHSLRSRALWGWNVVALGAGGSWSVWICTKEAMDTSALYLPLIQFKTPALTMAPLMVRVLLKYLQWFVSPLILLSWHFRLCVLLNW